MFCRKCGAQLNKGAVFCPKCGTKVAVESTAKQSEGAIHVAEERQNVYAMAQNDAVSFRNFVDNHVRSETTFSSAEDLITNSRPWRFVWISMGTGLFIGFLIGIISESVVVSTLLIGGILGYIALLLSGAIIRGNYCQKFCGEYEQDIDMNELLVFLNEHLRLVSPYFHECGYFSQHGGLLTIMDNAAIRMAKKVILCCKCGSRKKT